MKNLFNVFVLICMIGFFGCASEAQKEAKERREKKMAEKKVEEVSNVPASERVDLTNKGLGPITSIQLEPINEEMAAKGKESFKAKCSACHKVSKKFIGPSPKGVMKRRTPEWVMNMMLNPTEMLEKDPLAKELMVEFNGAPMANQNLTEEEAREILEYFRTLN